MSIIKVYVQDNLKGKTVSRDDLNEFDKVIESASIPDILDNYNAVLLTEKGASVLLECYNTVKISEDIAIEHLNHIKQLNDVIPDSYDFQGQKDKIYECMNKLNEVISIYKSPEYVYESTLQLFADSINNIDNDIVMEGANIAWDETTELKYGIHKAQAEFGFNLTRFAMTPDKVLESNGGETFLLEMAADLVKTYNKYQALKTQQETVTDNVVANNISMKHEVAVFEAPTQVTVTKDGKKVQGHDIDGDGKNSNGSSVNASGQSKMNKAAVKLDENSKKAAKAVRSKATDAKKTGTIVKRAVGRGTSLITDTMDKMSRANKEERMEAILTGGMRKRVSSILRTAIMTGAVGAINPALGLVTLLTSATLRKSSDDRLKREVRSEYESELKLVREKIRDAEAAGDRKKKYQLMRIENNLEQNIERINSPIRMNKPKIKKG